MDELILVMEQLAVEVALDEPEDSLQEGVQGLLIRSHHADAQLSALQQVLIPDFGHRDLEVVADPGLQALHDHALLFQSAATRQVQVEEGVSDDHETPSRETENGNRKTDEEQLRVRFPFSVF